MARTLNGLLEDAKAAVVHFGTTTEATAEALRTLREFSIHCTAYKNKYKSQPKVRKAILRAGNITEETAQLARRVIDSADVIKISQFRVRLLFVLNALSLSGYDEGSDLQLEARLFELKTIVPEVVREPSQLDGLFNQP